MAEKKKEKTCFVIMPISMPDVYKAEYKDNGKHFIEVYENLFVPAIEKVGLKPISPITKGSDLIQASIIENLNSSDLVLCDMSIFNPNVFFELGVRTALNKPVSYVRDESVRSIPFDNAPINAHTYKRFPGFVLNKEINTLAEHLAETINKSETQNQLWKYFGVSAQADLLEAKSEDPRYENLLFEIENLKIMIKNNINSEDITVERPYHGKFFTKTTIEALIARIFLKNGWNAPSSIKWDNKKVLVTIPGVLTRFDRATLNELTSLANSQGISMQFFNNLQEIIGEVL